MTGHDDDDDDDDDEMEGPLDWVSWNNPGSVAAVGASASAAEDSWVFHVWVWDAGVEGGEKDSWQVLCFLRLKSFLSHLFTTSDRSSIFFVPEI